MRERYGSEDPSAALNAPTELGSPINPSARAASLRTSAGAISSPSVFTRTGTAVASRNCPREQATERITNSSFSRFPFAPTSLPASTSASAPEAKRSPINPSATAAAPRTPASLSVCSDSTNGETAIRLRVLPKACAASCLTNALLSFSRGIIASAASSEGTAETA
jgi:hypothetical protein